MIKSITRGVLMFSVSLLFCSGRLLAQGITVPELEAKIVALGQTASLKTGQLGFALRSVSSGKLIIQYNAEKLLTPASTMKTVTTAAGLSLLGEDFKFNTYLEYSGTIDKEGVLLGNLFLRGSGDPSLCSEHCQDKPDVAQLNDRWLKAITAAGIKKVTGNIIADADIFEDNPVAAGWQWQDIGNYFGAPVTGLNIAENTYRVAFKPGKIGQSPEINYLDPSVYGLQLVNQVTIADSHSGDNAYIYGSPYTSHRIMSGTIPYKPSGFTIKGALPDPPLFCAQNLKEKMEKAGIAVDGKPLSTRIMRIDGQSIPRDRKVIDTYSSPSLAEIVAKTNIYSLNLFAESILRTIALKSGKKASTESGVEAVSKFWEARGVEKDELMMADGSGLSPTNAISPKALTQIFYLASKDKIAKPFYNSLAIAGQSGTLKDMCIGTKSAGNVRAKSGTLTRVLCYVGYFTAINGEKYCFAIMVNRYSGSFSEMKGSVNRILGSLGNLK